MARVRLAAACASASLLAAAGCGGGDDAGSSGIPRPLAARLAAASEAVAERLESGNPCEGLRLATRLEDTARTAVANARIPPALAGELLASIQDLERSVDCAPAAPPPAVTPTVTVEVQTDEDKHDDKPKNNHEDNGHGKDDERGEGD